jgi:hypothetical protein
MLFFRLEPWIFHCHSHVKYKGITRSKAGGSLILIASPSMEHMNHPIILGGVTFSCFWFFEFTTFGSAVRRPFPLKFWVCPNAGCVVVWSTRKVGLTLENQRVVNGCVLITQTHKAQTQTWVLITRNITRPLFVFCGGFFSNFFVAPAPYKIFCLHKHKHKRNTYI